MIEESVCERVEDDRETDGGFIGTESACEKVALETGKWTGQDLDKIGGMGPSHGVVMWPRSRTRFVQGRESARVILGPPLRSEGECSKVLKLGK